MRAVDWPWGPLHPTLPIGQMGKLRSRAYRTRTGIPPALPDPKTMTSQRISRMARVKICLCTWTHTHMWTEEVRGQALSSAPGIGAVRVSYASSRVIRGNHYSTGAGARADACPLFSDLCLASTSKRLAWPSVLGEGWASWPSTSEIPPLPAHSPPRPQG